jgi:hypothetical protein
MAQRPKGPEEGCETFTFLESSRGQLFPRRPRPPRVPLLCRHEASVTPDFHYNEERHTCRSEITSSNGRSIVCGCRVKLRRGRKKMDVLEAIKAGYKTLIQVFCLQ